MLRPSLYFRIKCPKIRKGKLIRAKTKKYGVVFYENKKYKNAMKINLNVRVTRYLKVGNTYKNTESKFEIGLHASTKTVFRN